MSKAQISPAITGKSNAGGPVKENPKDRLRYVWIPPGSFIMGCSSSDSQCEAGERPAHPVTIMNGFWVGQTEVTVAAYKRFAEATGKQMPTDPVSSGRPLNPGWRDDAMPPPRLLKNPTRTPAMSLLHGTAQNRALPSIAQWFFDIVFVWSRKISLPRPSTFASLRCAVSPMRRRTQDSSVLSLRPEFAG